MDAVSVSFWYNKAARTSVEIIFESTANFNSETNGFVMAVDGTGGPCAGNGMELSVRGDVGYNVTCRAALVPLGSWHHYLAVLDKSAGAANEVNLYVDGSLETLIRPGAPFASDNTNNFGLDPFYIMSRGGTLYHENGSLDDFRIYDHALTAAEAEALYQSRSKRPSGSLANGLIAHYELEDNEIGDLAGQVQDDSGNLYHGEFQNFTDLTKSFSRDVPAKFGTGTSLDFDGVSDYVNLGDVLDSTIIGATAAFTISTWFNANSLAGPAKQFIGKFNGTAAGRQFFFGQNTNQIQASIYSNPASSGSAETVLSTTSIATGTWYHATWSVDVASNRIRLYINGNLEDTNTNAFAGAQDVAQNLGLGAASTTVHNLYEGKLKDMRIYDKVLSNGEVSFLYNGSGSDPGTSNLQALWTFDDSAVKDSSGNDNHGIGIGGASLQYTEGVLNRN